ncbi:hypothetical protein ABCR94_28005 [Streptomyces sp. 21So2-11]|uniref:hypothetical protein n=1 Tax=Streptomyces sp. 21So2-11 TaxID=3144408 RepID=UPI00321A2832
MAALVPERSEAEVRSIYARTLLQSLVLQQGWTYEVFRNEYEKAASSLEGRPGVSYATASVSEATFRRWTSGIIQGLPAQPAPQVLTLMFGHPAMELLAPLPEGSQLTAAPPLPVLDESDIAMTARDAAAHAGDAASHTLPDMSLDQLDDDVCALAVAYGRTAPLEVYRRAKDLLTLAQAMLDRTQIPRQRTRAFLAAGQVASLLSAVSFDLGIVSSATQFARTSALYGQVIEHGPLQAYAHGTLAFLAYWGGRPREAARLVRTAQAFGGLGDTAHIRLAVIEGRAYGHLNDEAQANRAIRVALETDTGTRDELHDDIAGEFGFTTDRLHMSNATTHLLLKDGRAAEEAATHALQILHGRAAEARPVLITSQASADLATARLLRGEIEGAEEALEPVFQVPSEWRAVGMIERVTAARRSLTHQQFSGIPAARQLAERIEDFCSITMARPLASGGQLAIDP